MNQKCQRKREEEASLLANAVDNQPMSTQTISQATETVPATTEAAPAPAATTTEAAPVTTEAAPATTEAAPATTDVSVPVPEQPKKLVGCFAFA